MVLKVSRRKGKKVPEIAQKRNTPHACVWEQKCTLNSNLLVASIPQFTTLSITIPFWRVPTLLGTRHSHFREEETEAQRASAPDANIHRELETAEARNAFHSSLLLLILEPTGTVIN